MANRRQTRRRPRRSSRPSSKAAGAKSRIRGTSRLAQLVKAIVNKGSETKYKAEAMRKLSSNDTLATFTAFSSGITGVAEMYSALPHVAQGVDEHERIGDQISPLSCTVHLDITAPSFGQNQSIDRTVHVFLLTATSVKSLDNYSAVPISALLDDGNGGNTNFDGSPYKAMFPVNKRNFQVLRHLKFRLVKGFGKTNGSSATDPAGLTDSAICPSASYKHISMNVKLPKTLKYSAHGQKYPTNAAPFVVIGWTSNWGVDAASNVIDLQVIGRVEMRYKDE